MSEWKKYLTQVLNDVKLPLLETALKEMDLSINHGIHTVANSWGKEEVAAALVKNGKTLPLGFRFPVKDGKTAVELVGDFFATGLNEKTFMDNLAHQYQIKHIEEEATAKGWIIESSAAVGKSQEMILMQWA